MLCTFTLCSLLLLDSDCRFICNLQKVTVSEVLVLVLVSQVLVLVLVGLVLVLLLACPVLVIITDCE